MSLKDFILGKPTNTSKEPLTNAGNFVIGSNMRGLKQYLPAPLNYGAQLLSNSLNRSNASVPKSTGLTQTDTTVTPPPMPDIANDTQDTGSDIETPHTDIQYTANKLNELSYGTSPADLFSMRQRLARDQALAKVGQLPTDSPLNPVFDGLGITQGTPNYNYEQRMDVNKATTDMYAPQIGALDDWIKAQKDAGSGLDSSTLTKVQTVANAFDKLPIVKNYNAISEAKQFVDSLDVNSVNPSDDQGLIYAFAKTMDPDSAVREGEYATAQKYSQSMIKSFGKSVTQALNGTGFLSPEARENMKKTIDSRYNSNKKIYDNTYNEYIRRINKVSGGNDGADYLTNYAGYNVDTTTGASKITPQEIQQLKAMGHTQAEIDAYVSGLSKVGSGTKTASNRPQRNNNPLNIKASKTTAQYPGVAGLDPKPASDGGKFLVFNSPEAGFNAAKRLITSGGYTNLSVDQALRRWSGNGYGGEIVPQYRGRAIKGLSEQELNNLLKTMAHREGYYA